MYLAPIASSWTNADKSSVHSQYATLENGGVRKDKFWHDKPADLAGVNRQMQQQVQIVNNDMKRRIELMPTLTQKYVGGHFALFDTHGLVSKLNSTCAGTPVLTDIHVDQRHLEQSNQVPEWD